VKRIMSLAAAISLATAGLIGLAAAPPASATTTGSQWTWSGIALAANVPPVYGASMAYDTSTRQLILFGGQYSNASGDYIASDETWEWTGSTWTQLSPATSPSARSGVAMAFDPATSQLVLFGGAGTTGTAYSGVSGSTWEWTGSNWTKLSPTTSPSPRYGASMAYDASARQLILFGGMGGSGVSGSTWEWTGSNWTKLSPTTSPSPRSNAAMTFDPAMGQLILFGGEDAGVSTKHNGTWEWTGSNWTKLSPAASPGQCQCLDGFRPGHESAHPRGTSRCAHLDLDGEHLEHADICVVAARHQWVVGWVTAGR
jgi:hypothetical protein